MQEVAVEGLVRYRQGAGAAEVLQNKELVL